MRFFLLSNFFLVFFSWAAEGFAAPSPNQDAVGADAVNSKEHSYTSIEETPISRSKISDEARNSFYCIYKTHRCVVSIAPYLGIDSKALVLIPFYNQDVQLLQQWQKLENLSNEAPFPPLLQISGIFSSQPQAIITNNQLHNWVFNQNSAELDFSSYLPDIAVFADITSSQSTGAAQLASHPTLYLDRAFITVGDLNNLPLYGTVGKRYVPFGQYYSYMISGSIAQSIGKIKTNSMLLGYQHTGESGPYLSLYSFKVKKIMYGSTFGYTSTSEHYTTDVGVDWIQNIVEAQAFQTVLPNPHNTVIPGIDYHARLGVKSVYLLAEYTSAVRPFNPSDLSYHGGRALPSALNVETAYEFMAFKHSSSLALGYGATRQSAALGLPRIRYTITFNTTPWKNIILSAQYQHNINYPFIASIGNPNLLNGPAANTVIGKITLYF